MTSLSYNGPGRPAVDYAPGALLTSWSVYGPLTQVDDDAARDFGQARWRPFATDRRGAVITAKAVSFHGGRTVAYFRTQVTAATARDGALLFSTADDLALWVNGRFWWFVPRGAAAWHDFQSNPRHTGQRIPIRLQAGDNEIVVRVRGGAYATGGFFAAMDTPSTSPAFGRGPLESGSERRRLRGWLRR